MFFRPLCDTTWLGGDPGHMTSADKSDWLSLAGWARSTSQTNLIIAHAREHEWREIQGRVDSILGQKRMRWPALNQCWPNGVIMVAICAINQVFTTDSNYEQSQDSRVSHISYHWYMQGLQYVESRTLYKVLGRIYEHLGLWWTKLKENCIV